MSRISFHIAALRQSGQTSDRGKRSTPFSSTSPWLHCDSISAGTAGSLGDRVSPASTRAPIPGDGARPACGSLSLIQPEQKLLECFSHVGVCANFDVNVRRFRTAG